MKRWPCVVAALCLVVAACMSAPDQTPTAPVMPAGTQLLPLGTPMRSCPDQTDRIAVVRADPPGQIQAVFPAATGLDGFIDWGVPLVVAVYPADTFADGPVARKDQWSLCIEGSAGGRWTAGFASGPWTDSPLLLLVR